MSQYCVVMTKEISVLHREEKCVPWRGRISSRSLRLIDMRESQKENFQMSILSNIGKQKCHDLSHAIRTRNQKLPRHSTQVLFIGW